MASVLASTWPAPPSFYKNGTDRPPPAPVHGEYIMYGVVRTTAPAAAPGLEDQLYPLDTTNPFGELRKINRSLLSSFLQLLRMMENSPQQCNAKGACTPRASKSHHLPYLILPAIMFAQSRISRSCYSTCTI